MASIWELQNGINDRNNMKEKLKAISRNLKDVINESYVLSNKLNNCVLVNGTETVSASLAKKSGDDLKGSVGYIDNAIIPHIDWDVRQANNGIDDLRRAEED